jgi:uncharacterized protein YjbI with pentapeptide repeats
LEWIMGRRTGVANPEHLAMVRQGHEAWLAWRKANPEEQPDLSEADFRWDSLNWLDLSGVNLSGAGMNDAKLRGTNLRGALLKGTNLGRADLSLADLSQADLSQVDLKRAVLHRANLQRTCLRGADLTAADLSEANLRWADLRWTDLSDVNLSWADLRWADLISADLSQANLTGANLSHANPRRAVFSQALASQTHFDAVDLSTARELETMRHLGPSYIDTQALHKSKGLIPEVFLRGCGVSDPFMAYGRALAANPSELANCLISYADRDGTFAQRLSADLQAYGVRCWAPPEDTKIGLQYREQAAEVIAHCGRLLLVLSAASIGSAWAAAEVKCALDLEREHQAGPVLFVVRLDDQITDSNVAWTAEIRRSRPMEDFRVWREQETYERAFAYLMRRLRGERTPAGGGA